MVNTDTKSQSQDDNLQATEKNRISEISLRRQAKEKMQSYAELHIAHGKNMKRSKENILIFLYVSSIFC